MKTKFKLVLNILSSVINLVFGIGMFYLLLLVGLINGIAQIGGTADVSLVEGMLTVLAAIVGTNLCIVYNFFRYKKLVNTDSRSSKLIYWLTLLIPLLGPSLIIFSWWMIDYYIL